MLLQGDGEKLLYEQFNSAWLYPMYINFLINQHWILLFNPDFKVMPL